jgi:hypothetical protein
MLARAPLLRQEAVIEVTGAHAMGQILRPCAIGAPGADFIARLPASSRATGGELCLGRGRQLCDGVETEAFRAALHGEWPMPRRSRQPACVGVCLWAVVLGAGMPQGFVTRGERHLHACASRRSSRKRAAHSVLALDCHKGREHESGSGMCSKCDNRRPQIWLPVD